MQKAKQLTQLEKITSNPVLKTVHNLSNIDKSIELLNSLPITREQIIESYQINSIVLKNELEYFEKSGKLFSKIHNNNTVLQQELIPKEKYLSQYIYDYANNISSYYKNLDNVLERFLEKNISKTLLQEEMEKELNILGNRVEKYKADTKQFSTIINKYINGFQKDKQELNDLRKLLEEKFLNDKAIREIEEQIEIWYKEVKKIKEKKSISGNEHAVLQTMQGNIKLAGAEYKRRKKLIEYMNYAFKYIDYAQNYIDTIKTFFELMYGIWEAVEQDLIHIEKVTKVEIKEANDFLKSLVSDYTKDLWVNIAKSVSCFL